MQAIDESSTAGWAGDFVITKQIFEQNGYPNCVIKKIVKECCWAVHHPDFDYHMVTKEKCKQASSQGHC